MGAAVGIDLGTTFSVVAHVGRDGRPQALKNEFESVTTPSVVYIGLDETIVGEEARKRQVIEAERVAALFKREMGDPAPFIEVDERGYTPVELSALVLANLKASAERDLGEPVTDAVITVPAYFTHLQREDTKQAGKRAGLRVLEIINEPSAAARAYGFKPGGPTQTFLVYDLGGGTFDVSLVRITEDEIEVIATDGDHRLGGRDWDEALVLFLASRWREADPNASDLLESLQTRQDLWVKAESAKRTLSVRDEARVTLSHDGRTLPVTISRSQFDELTRGLIERTEMLCDATLRAANMRWEDLDGVLPVGGSSRMPMVRACIERLSGKPPMGGVNPDEAVAIGAAITAALAVEAGAGRKLYALPGRKRIQDVTAHSLGMIAESEDGSHYVNSRLIAKNSPIPSDSARPFTLSAARGAGTLFEIFVTQGESDDPQACSYPGAYQVTGFPEGAGRDQFIVDVTYRYEADGTVSVQARERQGASLTVTPGPVPVDIPDRFLRPPGQGHTTSEEPITLYLTFDVSGSMRGDPLAEAKDAAHVFVSECDLSSTAVGLIAFCNETGIEQRATNNRETIDRAIEALVVGKYGKGNYGQPFDDIRHLLADKPGRNYALVLTDGAWRDPLHAIAVARLCHMAGINIIAVGFGKANEHFLNAIRSADERSFFIERNQLSETFSSIARELRERFTLGLPGHERDAR